MRQFFTRLLGGLLLLFAGQLAAQSPVSLIIEDRPSATVGTEICLEVRVQDFTAINSMQFSINYDAAVLQYTTVTNFGLPFLGAGSFNGTANGVGMSWSDPLADGETLPDNAVLFEVCFNVLANTGTNVSIGNNPVPIEIANTSDQVLMVNTSGGAVNGGGSTAAENPTLTLTSASGAVGETVCIDLNVADFTDVNSLSFTITYPAAQLSFGSVANFGLPGLTAANFNTGTAGQIQVSWNDAQDNGETLADGTRLVRLCFVVQGAGTHSIALANVLAQDVNDNGLEANTQNGSITGQSGGGDSSGPLGFTVGTGSGMAGATVCVPVRVSGFADINSLQFSINYPAGQLTFASLTSFGLPGLSAGNFNTASPGQITFSWLDDQADGETLDNGSTIFQVCFVVNGNGTHPISITNNPLSIEVVDVDDMLLTPTIQNGSITGSGATGGGPLAFTVGTASGMTGETICVPITVTGFTNINSIQFSINYNAANLSFVSLGAFGLPGLGSGSFNTAGAGQITLSWLDDQTDGETLPNGATLFQVCFVANNPGTHPISITSNPVTIEVVDINDNLVTPTIQNGAITATGEGGGGGGALGFTIGTASGAVGETVCVPLTVTGFTDINVVQFSINYNATNLSFSSVGSFGLPGLGAGSFNTNNPGQILLSWSDPLADGESLNNGATLVELCFTVNTMGTHPVSITGNPLSIEVADVNDNILTPTIQNGSITGGGGGGGGALGFTIGTASGAVGETVCVPLTVTGFTDINVVQFSINYNATNLSFSSVGAFGLPGLGAGSFNTNNPGQILLSWSDPLADGESLNNGATLVELCFTVNTMGTHPVSITGNPLSIEVADVNDNILTPTIQNGAITGGGGGSGGPLGFRIGMKTGNVGQTICVRLTTTGFTDINVVQFSINYNATNLSFSSVGSFGLPGLGAGSFNTNNPGQILLSWSDPLADGESLPNGSTVVELCFVVNNPGTHPVSITGNPLSIEVADAEDNIITPTIQNGSITGNTGGGSDDLTFNIGSGSGDVGQEVCIPVTVANFADINVVQFSINYDPNQVMLNGIDQFGLPGLGNGSFNAGTPGEILLSWSDALADGETLPDGSTIFRLCFTVLSLGSSDVVITGSPLSIEVADINDNVLEVVTTSGEILGMGAGSGPVIQGATEEDPNCSDSNDGSIMLNVASSNEVTYTWQPNVSTGPTATGLGGGTYAVTVTDQNNGLTTSASYTLVAPSAFVASVASVTGNQCFGDGQGRIELTANGGTPPYAIDWSGGLPDDQLTQTGLDGGSYGVTLTDANGCTQVLNNIQVGEPNMLIAPGTITDVGDTPGSVNITPTGGTPNYTYAWAGPQGFTSTQQDITNLSVTGQYCVTVTDMRGCEVEQCYAVREALRIADFNIRQACAGTNSGSVDVTISGGVSPYSYSWTAQSGGFTSQNEDIANLAPNTYTLQVTDNANNSITGTFEIQQSAPITIAGTVVPAGANCSGLINATVSGGEPTFQYSWSNGATGPSINSLCAGEYCLTVTDFNGCERTRCFQVPAAQLSATAVVNSAISCNGGTSGVVRINVQGGVGPYTVTTETGTMVASGTTPPFTVSGLGAGTYQFTVTDAQETTTSVGITLTEPSAIAVVGTTIVNDTEDSSCTGSLTLQVQGGTPPYTVAWNVGVTGPQINSLCAGSYVATITDSRGCTFQTQPTTISMLSESVQIATASCADNADGSITQTLSGGTEPYTFAWRRQGTTEVIATTRDLTSVLPGTYVVTITDATGAMLVRTHKINVASGFSIATRVVSNYNGFGVSCATNTDGILAVAAEGVGEFSYSWERDGAMVGVGDTLRNAGPGTYQVFVRNEQNCELSATLEVIAPPALEMLVEDRNNITCEGERDGEILVEATGGVAPYRYLWSNDRQVPRLSLLAAGTYGLTVEDANGCQLERSYEITAPEPLLVMVEVQDATEGCNGSVKANVFGGTAPFNYRWVQLQGAGNVAEVTDLCAGDYTVMVTDANGCGEDISATGIVLNRAFPCLSERPVITPNGDGLNESFILFCSEGAEVGNNSLEIFNRWGQLVFQTDNYACSDDDGFNCFEGKTNDGADLPAGPYYYVLEYENAVGERRQKRGSLTIVRER